MRSCLFRSLFAALFFFSLVSQAQPVLTSPGVNPVIGDHYTLHYGNYLPPGNSGNLQAWDLSALTVTSTVAYTLASIAQAPTQQFSTTSNIQMNDGTVYSFFNLSSAVYAGTGSRAGSTVTIIHTDAEDLLRFPFSYNDSYTDGWAATFTLSNIAFNRTGSTAVSYDGYGSLQLATGLYPNVARVCVQQSYTDVSAFNTTTYINDQYLWYMNGHHQALAGVFSSTVNGSPSSQGAFYSADTVFFTGGKTIKGESHELLVYPNPARDEVQVSWSGHLPGAGQLQVLDGAGRPVYSKQIPAGQAGPLSIRLADIAPGLYLLRLSSEKGRTGAGKISIVK